MGAFAYSSDPNATVKLAVKDSQVNKNNYGLVATSDSGAPAILTASGNMITNSGIYGVYAQGPGAKVWATGNTVTDNVTGLSTGSSGVIESAGNNAVRNNGTDQSGTVTVIPMK